jgi:hypothetical protein
MRGYRDFPPKIGANTDDRKAAGVAASKYVPPPSFNGRIFDGKAAGCNCDAITSPLSPKMLMLGHGSL